MYQFNRSKSYFLQVTSDNRIILWDTLNSTLKHQFKEPEHLKVHYTCMSYVSPTDSESAESDFGHVALGNKGGRIVIWELAKEESYILCKGKDDAISDICMDNERRYLYSSSENSKFVLQWDIVEKTIRRQFVGGKPGVTKLALSPSGKLLLSAGPNIRLWNVETGEKMKRFVGHPSPTTFLHFVSDKFFISSCEDRFCSLWTCKSTKLNKSTKPSVPLSKKPLLILASSSQPTHISSLASDEEANCRILISSSNEVKGWDLDLQKGFPKETSRESNFSVNGRCLAAGLINIDECIIVHEIYGKYNFRKLKLNPLFEHTENITLHESEDDVKLPNGVVSENVSSEPTRSTRNQKKIRVYDGTPRVPMTTTVDISMAEKSTLDERPLGQRIKEMAENMGVIAHDSISEGTTERLETASKRKRSPDTAKSLTNLLEQAIQANDNSLLETCLNQTDGVIISNTVKKLSTSKVLPLIKTLIKKYEMKPSRSKMVLKWLESIFKFHAAYLVTVSDLSDILGGLYESVKVRASMLDKFTQLSGKLDFLVSQVEMQVSARGAATGEIGNEETEERATITYEEI